MLFSKFLIQLSVIQLYSSHINTQTGDQSCVKVLFMYMVCSTPCQTPHSIFQFVCFLLGGGGGGIHTDHRLDDHLLVTRKVPILQMETTALPPTFKNYFSIAPILWTMTTNTSSWLFAISSQMLGPTGLKKDVKKKSWKWFGHSFADVCVYTIVVSVVVYSGIEL